MKPPFSNLVVSVIPRSIVVSLSTITWPRTGLVAAIIPGNKSGNVVTSAQLITSNIVVEPLTCCIVAIDTLYPAIVLLLKAFVTLSIVRL